MEKLLNYNGLEKYNDLIHEDLAKKANIDGYYESLGAGTADQLSSNIVEKDSAPYNFRTAGGSIDIGDREVDKIIGGTVAWNQLVNVYHASGTDENGITFTNNNNKTISISGTVTTAYSYNQCLFANIGSLLKRNGNKYLILFNKPTPFSGGINGFSDRFNANSYGGIWTDTGGGTWDGTLFLRLPINTSINLTNFAVNVIDLTQMFGSTIADYIYSLEQANAGAGVAFFRNLFPKPYYEYNAGELMSVQASSHDMVGFNVWDEEWELGGIGTTNGIPYSSNTQIRSKNLIKVLPNTTYYIKQPSRVTGTYLYDANGDFISYDLTGTNRITTPSNAMYLRLGFQASYGTTYNHDICINLSWDGERDGEYEPYVKHSYPLDSSLTLRGIFKMDADNNLYADGDEYESDGNVKRRYGIVDLGTLNWTYYSDYSSFATTLSTDISTGTAQTWNAICKKYPVSHENWYASAKPDKTIGLGGSASTFVVKDSAYTDATTFKTAMSGIYLVYELATPTEETAESYTNPQIVDDFGTEEYVDYAYANGDRDVAIPVGHYTEYMANLKAKLEMAPNSPEGAGDYIVRQTNGTNEYVSLASNATIQNIIARLEALEGDTEGGGE